MNRATLEARRAYNRAFDEHLNERVIRALGMAPKADLEALERAENEALKNYSAQLIATRKEAN